MSADNRATVRPPFDPQDFARQSECLTARPSAGSASDTPELASSALEALIPVEDTSVPALAVAREDLDWFELAPRARALLEHIDGAASIEVICIRIGLPLTEGIDALDALAREGLVVWG